MPSCLVDWGLVKGITKSAELRQTEEVSVHDFMRCCSDMGISLLLNIIYFIDLSVEVNQFTDKIVTCCLSNQMYTQQEYIQGICNHFCVLFESVGCKLLFFS